ncbi:protein kinase domain-containing protein [Streptomyces sp. JW3]|uniref:serine/threonine-protein kinase n=1 Tax=Streptomyces sp. JW3 TaxID=3456955 RepID=UPI003FA45109
MGRYRLVGRLGQGGMGRVYLARSPGGRPAAVKVINDHLQYDEQIMVRFRREVETLGTIRSAYTATLIDSELATPPYWLATEYVPGPTLHAAVTTDGPFAAELCRALLAALAEGLDDIHVHGVWHRDIKPHNIILSSTGPQLIDFGIARSAHTAGLTQAGSWVGSPGYTAPETITRGETGPAADVFALGATLAFVATGRPPYGDGDIATVSYRSVHEDVDLRGVAPDLAALVAACTHRDPDRRPGPREIIEMCAARTDLVLHPTYQRALTSGMATAPALAAPVTADRPTHPATLVAATRVGPPPALDAAATQPRAPIPAAVPPPAGAAGTGMRRRPLVLAGGAVAAVAVVAAVLLSLRGAGTADHPSAKAKAKASTAAGRAVGDSKGSAVSPSPTRAAATEPAADGTDLPDTLVVEAGRRLTAGEYLQTGRAKLIMQPDGNLVVYDEQGAARWASRTTGDGIWAVFQDDGNLVLYGGDAKPVWASRTPGHQGAVLELEQDGNVVIRQGDDTVWQTGTGH